MKYLYVDNLAYPYALQSVYAAKGQWPEGKGVDIDEAIFREYFHDTPPDGKYRITGDDGMPAPFYSRAGYHPLLHGAASSCSRQHFALRRAKGHRGRGQALTAL